jgi:tetratricopeptide (TPR) repeat protein
MAGAGKDRRRGMGADSTEAEPPAPDSTGILRDADAALRGQRLGAAAALYRQALSLSPRSVPAMIGLATLARRCGDLAEALRWRETIRDLRPDSALAWTDLGDAFGDLGRTTEAEDAYRRAAALKPGDPRSVRPLLGLAACARGRGDRGAALAAWNAAAEAALSHDASLRQVAGALRAAGEHDHAAALFARLLAARPDTAEAALALGLAERARGRREAARDAFRRLLAGRPDDISALLEAATEESALTRHAEAAELIRRALHRDPLHPAARRRMADLLRESEGDEAAIAWLRTDLAARPGSRAQGLYLAQLLADAGEPGEALAALDAALAGAPEDTEVRLKRIGLLQRLGDLPRARALAREATALDPASVPAWQRCVELETALGGWEEAARLLDAPPPRAAPGLAHRLRGQLAMARWRPTEAAGHFRQALASGAEEAGAHLHLARALLADCAPDDAMAHVRAWATAKGAPSLKPRYLFEGRMVEEFTLDRVGLAALQAAQRAPAGTRIAALAEVVRAQPDSTGAAIALLLALRAEGALDPAPAGTTERPSPIPRRIVRHWAGGTPPPAIVALGQAWQGANPGFTCELVADAEAREMLRDDLGGGVAGRLGRHLPPAQLADLFRLVTLHRRGGLFVDPAARPVGAVAPLLPGDAGLVLLQAAHGHVETGLLAAAPGHPVLARAIAALLDGVLRGDMDTRWLATGPGALTRAVAAEIAAAPDGPLAGLRALAFHGAPEVLGTVACPQELPRGTPNLSGGLLTY